MTVKIIDAIKSIKTSKYNKKNILYCSIFILCLTIITSICEIHVYNFSKIFFILFPLSLLFLIIIESGYSAIACNKEANKENDVFPSLNNFKEIFTTGIKTTLGILIIWIIAGLIICITSGFLTFITIIGMANGTPIEALIGFFIIIFVNLAILLSIIFDYYFLSPITANYFKNLNFKDFFNLKDARNFRKERGNHYTSYFLKYFLILIITIILGFINAYYSEQATNSNNNFFFILITISISFFISMFCLLIFPNLIAQVYDTSNVTDYEEEFLTDEDFEEVIQNNEEKENFNDKIFDDENFE